ncbi:hypothetical protein ZTR_06231 [Talaromyces verruculosus]|nr:hypothetical protein ZTR_06231 [Talaromyces verruculosus]
MKSSVTKVFSGLFIGLLLGTPALGNPVPVEGEKGVEKRQFIEELIIAAIVNSASGALKSILGPEQPGCTWKSTNDNDNWWARVYTEISGTNYTAADICWTQGGYTITDNDAQAATCLINEHINQDFSCISQDSTNCNYPGSAFGNVRILHDLSTSAHQQLDSFAGERAINVTSTIPGLDHGFDITTNVNMLIYNNDGTSTGWTVELRGTGDEDC